MIREEEEIDSDFQRAGNSPLMTHDEVLIRIGSCGWFIKFASFVLVAALMTGDLIINNLAFY